ncbi:5-oxoprolinase subunit PxpB [Metabacillus idriensis]|uniref:5-oxoprolinase subunit PxpB n=1 Tax=Metabacillus idriensis TaxID=324768 RepID=UPI0017490205|nr:5-oxoprolinase subunit PxpB [Metabacillus idriensis]
MEFNLSPLGDNAIIIELGKKIEMNIHEHVQRVFEYFNKKSPEWVIECIPAFTTVTLFYNPLKVSKTNQHALPYQIVSAYITESMKKLNSSNSSVGRTVEIPVCYGGELGPDLNFVAEHNSLSVNEVIQIHSANEYLVYMIGFAPGFPYIGGMSEKIAAPRRKSPRLKIPAGSVGIAGTQTGIYPIETPGGWQLIGQTPVKLFQPESETPTLLKAGDTIKFKPISYEQYLEVKEGTE